MSAKRALVVDDSRSARAFLAKLLQEQQVEVDAADSAEEAIEYLTRIRPDVIFMDHLMPGMDGFQAVQAIKSNPRTADIPVLMYTSQEGELYLGQARALGAVGVLPKNMEQADVRRVLQQLDLAGAAPTPTVAAQPEVLDAAVAAAATVDSQVVPVLQGPFFEEMLREEVAALRQHVSDALAAHGRRVTDDMRVLLREAMPPAAEPLPPPVIEPEPPRHSPLAWLVAVAASVAAAVLGTLLWRGEQERSQLRTELADARATSTLLTARLSAPVAAPVALPAASGGTVVLPIAFGDAPLGGARIEQLREFVGRVAVLGQPGTVEVRRQAGRFCLADSGAGYVLAEPATPVSQCALVAEATDPALARGTPETAAFASALAALRQQYAAQQITIDVGVEPAGSLIAYPEAQGTPPREPTAGEWNAVAEQNNRVVMRWLPAP